MKLNLENFPSLGYGTEKNMKPESFAPPTPVNFWHTNPPTTPQKYLPFLGLVMRINQQENKMLIY